MKITNQIKHYDIEPYKFSLERGEFGVVQIEAQDLNSKAFAMGILHATDRPFQMELVRLVSQGRLCECLSNSKENLEIDIFMRGLDLYNNTDKELQFIDEETTAFFQAYADGVDYIFQKQKALPKMLKFLKHRPAKWEIKDCMAISKLMSYVGLAQSQQDVEKFIVQAIKNNVSTDKLKSLFSPHLDQMTDTQVSLIKKVKMSDLILPNKLSKLPKIPLIKGSNNWVVNGSRSFSGKPFHSMDPHLECNRLPAIWYEFKCKLPDNYFVGINMPGIPGTIMGRSKFTSFSFTYGFMDTIDYFIEEVKDEQFREHDGFRQLIRRGEIIKRKGSSDLEVTFFSTPNGTLEVDAQERHIEDGFYLARAWSGNFGASGSLMSLYKMHKAKSVKEMQSILGNVAISCNWLIADSENNIGYQQSGRAPRRSHSGLYPIEGWIKTQGWDGYLKPEELSSHYNPECGYIVTANDDANANSGITTVNLHMGSARSDRIIQLLNTNEKLTIEDHQVIQMDLYSKQAEAYMEVLRPIMPNSTHTLTLNGWNLKYEKSSKGAVLFEKIYMDILKEVFGKNFLGEKEWNYIVRKTGILEDFFHLFDRILLNPKESELGLWFNGEDPKFFLANSMERTLKKLSSGFKKRYGQTRKITMKNIFYGKLLPALLGQNHGPVIFEGSRATVNHGSIFFAHGRQTSFAPSYRMVTDMNEDIMYTILAGGQAEQKGSAHYKDQVDWWLKGNYKKITQ